MYRIRLPLLALLWLFCLSGYANGKPVAPGLSFGRFTFQIDTSASRGEIEALRIVPRKPSSERPRP